MRCYPTTSNVYTRARKEYREAGSALAPPEYHRSADKMSAWAAGVRDEQQAQASGQAVRA